jgi:hypothetical protein
MTNEDKIKALAELDGWTCEPEPEGSTNPFAWWKDGDRHPSVPANNIFYYIPKYLTSYNAIIPLIQKLSAGNAGKALHERIEYLLWTHYRLEYMTQANPSQLCDALLRATGKRKE